MGLRDAGSAIRALTVVVGPSAGGPGDAGHQAPRGAGHVST